MFRPSSRRLRCLSLTLVTSFVLGGFLAPLLHRAQHVSLDRDHSAESGHAHAACGEICFAPVTEDFDEDCLLCVRNAGLEDRTLPSCSVLGMVERIAVWTPLDPCRAFAAPIRARAPPVLG